MKKIFCNWKGYLSYRQLGILLDEVIKSKPGEDVVFFPSIESLAHCVNAAPMVQFGAQNLPSSIEPNQTGEVAAVLLAELKLRYALIGHSERRLGQGETGATLLLKLKVAEQIGIVPVFCCGESLEQRKSWKEVLLQQLEPIEQANLDRVVIAYEPVWSIGTGVVPSIAEIEEVYQFLKSRYKYEVLYGGSVNVQNAAAILEIADGVLIGKASTDISQISKFIAMVK